MQNANLKLTNVPEGTDYHCKILGGSAAASKVADTGQGMTVTYVSTGRIRLTWLDNPYLHETTIATFQATTPADVNGWTVVGGEYTVSGTSYTQDLYVYDESFALADLPAACWLNVLATFKRGGSGV